MLPRARLFAAVAALVLTAVLGLAAALSPVAQAAPGTVASPDGSSHVAVWSPGGGAKTSPVVHEYCPSRQDLVRPGVEYRVKYTGINIRVAPQGKIVWGIGKGSQFLSDWFVGNAGGYRCTATVGGHRWLLGFWAGNHEHFGWVRMDYLTFVKYLPEVFAH